MGMPFRSNRTSGSEGFEGWEVNPERSGIPPNLLLGTGRSLRRDERSLRFVVTQLESERIEEKYWDSRCAHSGSDWLNGNRRAYIDGCSVYEGNCGFSILRLVD